MGVYMYCHLPAVAKNDDLQRVRLAIDKLPFKWTEAFTLRRTFLREAIARTEGCVCVVDMGGKGCVKEKEKFRLNWWVVLQGFGSAKTVFPYRL